MGGLTGVEVAKEIRRTDQNVKLVFCSHSNEFATESYEVNAQYYLLKPATPGSIVNMLQRLNLDIIQRQQFVTLPDGHDVILRDILYTEYYNHVVTIYLKNTDPYRIRTNHAIIEEILAPGGFIHSPCKGILVNFYEVTASSDDSFTMSNGTVIPISRRRRKEIQSTYIKFRFQQMRSEVGG
jgi:DNA-binding LytR/AlgR family response regulator